MKSKSNSYCEICNTNKVQPVIHHIHSTSKGGLNVECNRCMICPNCHAAVHHGDIIIEGRFESTGGNVVVYRYKGDESISGLEDPPVWIYDEQPSIVINDMSQRKKMYYDY